jgi:predicted AlkP superfamily pyrophosphatase or phosphodiesterase
MRSRLRFALLSALLVLLRATSAFAAQDSDPLPVIRVDNGPNVAAQMRKHYVVLVSIDGFRYDYAKKFNAVNLLSFSKHGASAPGGMIPSYPSVTFPNHYTLVTGLYPEHHGIVAMNFYDPQRRQFYAFSNSANARDGSWYGGTPIWALAEQQGMRTACFFWPGSEAEIQGKRPSYYLNFNDKLPEDRRVDEILSWLTLPPERRPHLITLYLSDVDHAGHSFGPESVQTREAVAHVDQIFGRLMKGLGKAHLPVDVIVVSDHGMEQEVGPFINLDQFADLSGFQTSGALLYPPSEAAAQKAFAELNNANEKFHVYRRANMPPALHYDSNPRIGDPVVVPTGPYAIRAHPRTASNDRPPNAGVHGYDAASMFSMRASFFAAGPDIRSGVRVAPFENTALFPLLEQLLGLDPIPVDGDIGKLLPVLKHRGTQHGPS